MDKKQRESVNWRWEFTDIVTTVAPKAQKNDYASFINYNYKT